MQNHPVQRRNLCYNKQSRKIDMPVTINSNSASRFAALNLERAQTNLQSSLSKLSSGKRIVQPFDDAAGEAVQLKMKAAINRYGQVKNNIQNAISFLQTQDGVYQTATELVSRMGELATMAADSSKSVTDKQLYDTEFRIIQSQISDLSNEQFNGVALFANRQTIYTSEAIDASLSSVILESGAISGTTANVTTDGLRVFMSAPTSSATRFSAAMSHITADLQKLATRRATNGAYQSVLNHAYNNAALGKNNMEAARGRIIDLDIAEESSNFARANILSQAASSMLAQANNSNSSVLQLLM
jgi:flagellin